MCHISLHKTCSSVVKNATEEVLCILQSALLDSGVAGQALLATLLNSCGKKGDCWLGSIACKWWVVASCKEKTQHSYLNTWIPDPRDSHHRFSSLHSGHVCQLCSAKQQLRLNYYELARQFDFQAQDLTLAFGCVLCSLYVRLFIWDWVCSSNVRQIATTWTWGASLMTSVKVALSLRLHDFAAF